MEDIKVCGSETICEKIQDFLEKDISAVSYENKMIIMGPDVNDADAKQLNDFLGEEDGSYDEYLRIKRDSSREIIYQEDKIQELMIQMKECMLIIKESKEKINLAFEKYISSQWQK